MSQDSAHCLIVLTKKLAKSEKTAAVACIYLAKNPAIPQTWHHALPRGSTRQQAHSQQTHSHQAHFQQALLPASALASAEESAIAQGERGPGDPDNSIFLSSLDSSADDQTAVDLGSGGHADRRASRGT
jgi:hypothetical protein